MDASFGGQTLVEPLRRVLVRSPRPSDLAGWRAFGWLAEPDAALAAKHEALCEVLRSSGVEVEFAEVDVDGDPDAIYVFDPAIVSDAGAIVLRPGKEGRRPESAAAAAELRRLGVPVAFEMAAPATARAGTRCGSTSAPCSSAGASEPTTRGSRTCARRCRASRCSRSTCRTGTAPTPACTCCRSCPRSIATSSSRTSRCCRSGWSSCWPNAASRSCRCRTRSSTRWGRTSSRSRRGWGRGRRQPGDAAPDGAGGRRGLRLRGLGDLDQGRGRPDVPHEAVAAAGRLNAALPGEDSPDTPSRDGLWP